MANWDLKIKPKSTVHTSSGILQIFIEYQLHGCLERPVKFSQHHRVFSRTCSSSKASAWEKELPSSTPPPLRLLLHRTHWLSSYSISGPQLSSSRWCWDCHMARKQVALVIIRTAHQTFLVLLSSKHMIELHFLGPYSWVGPCNQI